jgi:hypothetical protein
VNPFLQAPHEVRLRLTHVLEILEQEKLPETRKFLEAFLKKSAKGLIENQNKWSIHLPTEKAALVKLLTSGICA